MDFNNKCVSKFGSRFSDWIVVCLCWWQSVYIWLTYRPFSVRPLQASYSWLYDRNSFGSPALWPSWLRWRLCWEGQTSKDISTQCVTAFIRQVVIIVKQMVLSDWECNSLGDGHGITAMKTFGREDKDWRCASYTDPSGDQGFLRNFHENLKIPPKI